MIRPDQTVKPWYKETPKALVASIVMNKAWDRLPILADALEDDGCDNHLLLNTLRLPVPPQSLCGPWLDRVAAGVVSLPEADMAIAHMEQVAEEFHEPGDGERCYKADGLTPLEWTLGVLDNYVKTGEPFVSYGYSRHETNSPQLWEHYSVLTGGPPGYKEDVFVDGDEVERSYYNTYPFDCSC